MYIYVLSYYYCLIHAIICFMDFYSLSDEAIEKELGNRIKSLRLRKNITQKALAKRTSLSYSTIQQLEYGKGKLSTLITALRELDSLEKLDEFIPPITISPLQLDKMQGKKRQRESGSRTKNKS